MSQPPNELHIYRVLTGPDDSAFCQRVSEALELGYRLHGSPSIASPCGTYHADLSRWNAANPNGAGCKPLILGSFCNTTGV